MNVLALDTSTPFAAVALARSDGTVLVAPADASQRHGRGLIPAVQEVLRQAAMSLAEIDLFGVGLGPGSYTGLRVGVTAIKTLGFLVAPQRPDRRARQLWKSWR